MERIIYIKIEAEEEFCGECEWKKASGLCIDRCRLFNVKLKIDGLEDDCTEEDPDQPLRTFRCAECLERDQGAL